MPKPAAVPQGPIVGQQTKPTNKWASPGLGLEPASNGLLASQLQPKRKAVQVLGWPLDTGMHFTLMGPMSQLAECALVCRV